MSPTSESGSAAGKTAVPEPEAFLDEAKREPKRKLLLDHVNTIRVLRVEKKFTFREIAEWFNARGFTTDRSAVYRAFLLSIPKEEMAPEDQEELSQLEPE